MRRSDARLRRSRCPGSAVCPVAPCSPHSSSHHYSRLRRRRRRTHTLPIASWDCALPSGTALYCALLRPGRLACRRCRRRSICIIMSDQTKGSVTPLASMFPAEEAQKAARRVQDAIAERQKELERLRLFASDNANLINLVQRLPDELSHDIMVPFGKAAFFPGRLIHTNEFLVLLGEGYYAERTAKQTVEILQRRGKALEHQVESLKAVMTDLEAEAKFFGATAVEAKEGLVEIREDYVEEPATGKEAELGNHHMQGMSPLGTMNITDEEYAQIESRLDELEKEELAAECASSSSDDNNDNVEASSLFLHPLNDHDLKDSLEKQLNVSGPMSKGKEVLSQMTTQPIVPKQTVDMQSSSEDLKQQYNRKEDSLCNIQSEYSMKHSQAVKSAQGLVHEGTLLKVENYAHNASGQSLRIESDQPKRAFTGSVVERSRGLPPSMSTQSSTQSSSSNPSKPVSRFKMQRGSH